MSGRNRQPRLKTGDKVLIEALRADKADLKEENNKLRELCIKQKKEKDGLEQARNADADKIMELEQKLSNCVDCLLKDANEKLEQENELYRKVFKQYLSREQKDWEIFVKNNPIEAIVKELDKQSKDSELKKNFDSVFKENEKLRQALEEIIVMTKPISEELCSQFVLTAMLANVNKIAKQALEVQE